jgi:putative ABC transport system permease protein
MILSGSIKYEDKDAMPMLVGGEPDIEFVNLYNISSGRFISDQDIDEKSRVIAIGKTVANDLFGERDPLGEKILVNNEEFEIVGVIETRSLSNVGIDANSMVVIPISVASEMFDTDRLHRIIMQVEDQEKISEIQQQVEDLILERHGGVEDFSVLTQEDILSTLDQVLSLMTALLSGIAAISLVVGGIGIMNIMLVSVTERTREIGIRKAMGATAGNILIQFLTEAAVISLFGGAIGVAMAFLASQTISKFSPIAPEISTFAIVLAFGISVGIGIVFGVAPAIKAARKDPIEALRYE